MTIDTLIKRTTWWLTQFADFDDIHWEGQERREHRENVEEHQLILKLAENAKKYKWHDLRKDPEDMPKDDMIIAFVTSHEYKDTKRKTSYGFGTWKNLKEWVCDMIAWKEIDRFEVD